ncbi:MAG: hypothetical protein ACREBV_07845, partial [Candidatus Zixiibacteriota bacterium]
MKPSFVNCPGNTTVQCDAIPAPVTPTATDNCDLSPVVTYLGQTTTPGGVCPQAYTITRKWEARDDCGNADTCTQIITVIDTTRPTFINCPANAAAQCNQIPPVASPSATDNCDLTLSVTYLGEEKTPGSCPNQYTLTRKWRAADDCGNADTCTQIISVSDTTSLTLSPDRLIDSGFVCTPKQICFGAPTLVTAGCGPFNWTVNGFPTRPDTNICVNIGYCTNYDQTWTFIVSDSCGKADTSRVRVRATVNCPPVVQCPTSYEEVRVCQLTDTICVSGFGFACSDINNNVVSTTLNGQPYNPGDSICFVPGVAGPYSLLFICTDVCGKADSCAPTVDVILDPSVCPCPDITIEKIHNAIQGQFYEIAVSIDEMSYPIGGFNLLIEYDPSALSLSQVLEGNLITDCGWEYFNYRNGPSGNCGASACPNGKVRITAIAEINNGMNHPSCFELDPSELARLVFLVTNDRTFECQYIP